MVNLVRISVCFLLAFMTLTSAYNPETTNPVELPEVPHKPEDVAHIVTKRFIPLPIIIPAVYPRKSIHFRFGIRKQYTRPILYRYKRFLPSIQASSQAVISTNPSSSSSAITLLDGSIIWDKISAILALLQSLKQAIANIYQSSNLQAFMDWNRKALELLARIGALGVRFMPVAPVQNNTVLFNLGALIPHKKFLIPNVNVAASVGVNANTGAVVSTSGAIPGSVHQDINIVQTETHTVSTPEPDILSIYTPRAITQAPLIVNIPLTTELPSIVNVAASNVKVGVDSSSTSVKVADTPVGDINVDISKIFGSDDLTNNEGVNVNVGDAVKVDVSNGVSVKVGDKRNSDSKIDPLDVDKSPLSNNLLGDLKSSDRRKKRSIGFGPGIFARAQANFRRIFPSFEGFSSNWDGPVYTPAFRRFPQHGRYQNGGRKVQHYRNDVPKWEFPPRPVVNVQHPVRDEDFETSTENTSETSDIEVEEFNFLPHFESPHVFDNEIEQKNNKLVEYLQSVNSVPVFTKEEPFRSDSDDSASEKNKVYVQVTYSKPELAEYNEDINVNSGDFKALPNYQSVQKFVEIPIDVRFVGEEYPTYQTYAPVRHTFVEAPKPFEETRPFVVVEPQPLRPIQNRVNENQLNTVDSTSAQINTEFEERRRLVNSNRKEQKTKLTFVTLPTDNQFGAVSPFGQEIPLLQQNQQLNNNHFVEARPLEQIRPVKSEENPSVNEVQFTLTDPMIPQMMPFLIAPIEEFEEAAFFSKLDEDEAPEDDQINQNPEQPGQVIETVEVDDIRALPKPKNRFRKLPKIEIANRFNIVPANDLVLRQDIPNDVQTADHRHGDVVTNARQDFDKQAFAMTSEIVLNDDKKKIGRRIIYKRVKKEDTQKK